MSTRVQAVRWKIARRHLHQRKSHRLRWLLVLFLVLLATASSVGGAAGYYIASHMPSARAFHVRYAFQDARIYDSSGQMLYTMSDLSKTAGKRIVEPLQGQWDADNACRGGKNRIPLLLQDATIATEDATFYKNPGFDPGSIVRAAYQDIVYGHIVSGASTITQQVVRAAHLVSDKTSLTRKAKEVEWAYEISRVIPKRTILWYYLNTVPYGNLAYGAQAAAQVYFSTQVCRLDLAQAAMLAGLPQAPSLYDPVTSRVEALDRMNTVLTLMWKHGYLRSRAQIAGAMAEASRWHFHLPQGTMRYPQFTRYAINQISSIPQLRGKLYQGIDVYTTLNPHLQDVAQSTVTHQIQGLAAQHVTNGALVSLDLRPHRYGWILAMVGSAHTDAKSRQINMAITPRQPGSSMKPFNYIWAFQHAGVGPGTTVSDTPIKLPDPHSVAQHGWYQPQNYDHQWHGTVTLRDALANSLNVPAVKVEYYLTSPKHVAGTAYRYGMHSIYRDNPGLDCPVCYAVTLGGLSQGTRLIEETSAYGVFATQGQTVPPVAIWKVIQRSTGKVLYCSSACPRGARPDPSLKRSRQQVLDPAHAYEMSDVLSDNNARCAPQVCEFGLTSPLELNRRAAAKTGTTNAWTDNWTVGYTPQIVTGVWAGNADRSPMRNVIGVTGAAPIWHDYMESAFRILRLPATWYPAPPNVVRTPECSAGQPNVFNVIGTDLFVPDSTHTTPACSLPDKGFMPVPCSRYPHNFNGFPRPQDCAATQPYTYTYRYTSNGSTYTYGVNPNTPSTSQPYTPPPAQYPAVQPQTGYTGVG